MLERIIRHDPREGGIVKTHLIQECGLKAATAEKYLQKLEEAGYIQSYEEVWGERTRIRYRALPLGVERYSWFLRINAELYIGGGF
jgi:predicted transcriptional regulator